MDDAIHSTATAAVDQTENTAMRDVLPTEDAQEPITTQTGSKTSLWIGATLLAATFAWSYWPTLSQLVNTWNTQPDYSHGFLVPLLSLFFLYVARDRFPGVEFQFAWLGLAVLMASLALRLFAGYFYIPQIDAWSIPLWVLGVVWLFGGKSLAMWCLPSALFLYFMIPLPYRVDIALSYPLQTAATQLSVAMLQCVAQPAIADGHTIYLAGHRLEVEQACSGLRMLVGVAALAVAYTIIFRRSWWERALLLASVIPVAMLANASRIVVTGLLYRYISSDAGKKFGHDFAGWAMIPMAMALLGGVLWYLQRLFPEQEVMDVGQLLRRQQTATAPVRRSR